MTQEILNECFSSAAVLRYLEIPDGENSRKALKEIIEEKNFSINHFKGNAWHKNVYDYSRFTTNSHIKAANARSALIALRGYACENCGIVEWQGEQIPLEVHHIDGNSTNNTLENLLILCPNCHSLTKNWRGRNQNIGAQQKIISDEELIEAIKITPNIRQALLKVGLSPKGGNYKRVYELKAKYNL